MNNSAVFVRLGEVRKHPNADRLQLTTIFGNQVVVGMNAKEGDVGIYFDSNLQLSEEFAKANDLIRRKDEAGNNAGGMFDANRKVRCQKLRGERSDGFFIELKALEYIDSKLGTVLCQDGNSFAFKENVFDSIKVGKYNFKVGDEFTEIGGHPICNKFIVIQRQGGTNQKVGKKKFKFDSIMFKEHIDTAQLSRNLDKIDIDKQMVIAAKLHGTSGRYANVLVEQPLPKWKEIINKAYARILSANGLCKNGFPEYQEEFNIQHRIFKPEVKWMDLHGTRRVTLQPTTEQQITAFHDPQLRELAVKPFVGNLKKGETVFFEIVGFEPNGKPIMPTVDTTKLKDKEFTKQYGKLMTFSYGCKPEAVKITSEYKTEELSDIVCSSLSQTISHKQFDVYVYRINMTNEDGFSIEYSWEDIKERCKELGVKHVPEIFRGTIEDLLLSGLSTDGDKVLAINWNDNRLVKDVFIRLLDEYTNRPDLIDPSHILEGVVIRFDSGFKFDAYKHKSFQFKVLEDILSVDGIGNQEDDQNVDNDLPLPNGTN